MGLCSVSAQRPTVATILSLTVLLVAIAWVTPVHEIILELRNASFAQLLSQSGDENLLQSCPHRSYRARIYSSSPLVIHIENFVHASEAQHLVESK